MEEASVFAWNFYQTYATGFAREFGLMPDLLRETGYHGPEKSVFLAKLDLVHRFMIEKARDKAAAEGNTNG